MCYQFIVNARLPIRIKRKKFSKIMFCRQKVFWNVHSPTICDLPKTSRTSVIDICETHGKGCRLLKFRRNTRRLNVFNAWRRRPWDEIGNWIYDNGNAITGSTQFTVCIYIYIRTETFSLGCGAHSLFLAPVH